MAHPSRRSVLRAALLLAATSAPLVGAERAFSVVAAGAGGALRRSAFKPHVGSTFLLSAGGTAYRAKLVKVSDAGTAAKGHDQRFRLVFKISGGGPGQGTYRLANPRAGAVDLFVSPIGAKSGVYEAVVDSRR